MVKYKNIKGITFNDLCSWSAFVFSCYSMHDLYNKGSLLWIVLGLFLVIIFIIQVQGVKTIHRILGLPPSQQWFYTLFILLSSSVYYLSAMSGVISIAWTLPLIDKSQILFPIVILGLLFGGSSISIFHNMA